MMIISDTTCVSTLFQIDKLDILSKQFLEIIIPEKVFDELSVLEKFNADFFEIKNVSWLLVRTPSPSPLLTLLDTMLDGGEAQAIALSVI